MKNWYVETVNCPKCKKEVKPKVNHLKMLLFTALVLAFIGAGLYVLVFLGIDIGYISAPFWALAFIGAIITRHYLPHEVCPNCNADLRKEVDEKRLEESFRYTLAKALLGMFGIFMVSLLPVIGLFISYEDSNSRTIGISMFILFWAFTLPFYFIPQIRVWKARTGHGRQKRKAQQLNKT